MLYFLNPNAFAHICGKHHKAHYGCVCTVCARARVCIGVNARVQVYWWLCWKFVWKPKRKITDDSTNGKKTSSKFRRYHNILHCLLTQVKKQKKVLAEGLARERRASFEKPRASTRLPIRFRAKFNCTSCAEVWISRLGMPDAILKSKARQLSSRQRKTKLGLIAV